METATITFTKTSPSNWRSMARYRVAVEGVAVGVVERFQDSSKTGGLWTASWIHRSGSSSGHVTRTAAVEALVRG